MDHLTKDRIRLTFLVRSLDFGGAQRQLVTLARALDKSTFDVSIITFYAGQPLERELANSEVRLISLGKSGRWDLAGFLNRLVREVKILKPHILHGYLDIPNTLALFLGRLVKAKVVWGVRASALELRHYDWLIRLAARVESRFSRCPDLIIVNSSAALEHHRAKGFPEQKLKLVPNGIDLETFKPNSQARRSLRDEWGIAETVRLVGTVGRLDPVKDLYTFLRSAAIVCGETTDVRFICAGDGPAAYRAQLVQGAKELNLTDKIMWVKAHRDVTPIYNALDVLVSTSSAESFPNSIAEAMSCGVPCVATDVGDSALLVGETGIVVPPQDPSATAAGIISLLRGSQIDNRMIRARIEEKFSASQLATNTERLLKQLLVVS